MPVNFYSATQGRERARRTRATIDQLVDPSARKTMATIASAYEKLAAQAEAHARGNRPPPKSSKEWWNLCLLLWH